MSIFGDRAAYHKARSIELEKETDQARKERDELRLQIAELKVQKKVEEQELKHLLALDHERMEIEFQKKEIESEAERKSSIASIKSQMETKNFETRVEYQQKIERGLEQQLVRFEKMYSDVLSRLPDVSVAMDASFGNRASKRAVKEKGDGSG